MKKRCVKQFPGNSHGIDVELLSQQAFGNLRSIMNILLAAVAFILLIAFAAGLGLEWLVVQFEARNAVAREMAQLDAD